MKKILIIIILTLVFVTGCEKTKESAVVPETTNANIEITTKPISESVPNTPELYSLNELIEDETLRKQVIEKIGKGSNVTIDELAQVKIIDITKDVKTLEGITLLSNLSVVIISYNNTNELEYEYLKEIPALRELCFKSNYIFDSSNYNLIRILGQLEDLTGIEEITIYDPTTFEGSVLSEFDQINKVVIDQDSGTQSMDLSGLAEMDSLEVLDLSLAPFDESFPGLEALTNIKELNLFACAEFTDFEPILELVNLERLYLANCYYLNDNDIKQLSKLKKLKRLSIGKFGEHNIDLKFVTELKDLEYLELAAEKLINTEAIGELDKLTEIDLRAKEIESLDFLASNKQLEVIKIFNIKITDMSTILNLPNLKTLVIDSKTANAHRDIIKQLRDNGVTVDFY